MIIAHLSDPHINQRHFPHHLINLRSVLTDAIAKGVDHIVISGDITSNAEERDYLAARDLFCELGLLRSDRLTVIPGNHDIFGGPILAEDIVQFPKRCRESDYEGSIARFQAAFEELFQDISTVDGRLFPFVKRLDRIALLGVNTIARYSSIFNPVGSNGEVDEHQYAALERLLGQSVVGDTQHRIAVHHHHVFRRTDVNQLHMYPASGGLFARIEQETLRLRGKPRLIKMLKRWGVSTLLHGHVHFTGDYIRDGIRCYNGAGAVCPMTRPVQLTYNLLHCHPWDIHHQIVSLPPPEDDALLHGSTSRRVLTEPPRAI